MKKNYLLPTIVLLLMLTNIKSFSQPFPFIYYQFDSAAAKLTASGSICIGCNLTGSLPTTHIIDTNTTSQVGRYLDFSLSNSLVTTDAVTIPHFVPKTSGITVELLLNLDPDYGLQRQNTLFSLKDNQKDIIAQADIEYAKIVFQSRDSTPKKHVTEFDVNLVQGGSQSWNTYVNSDRNSNWHLFTFVYDGSYSNPDSLPYKAIYIDGHLPGDYNDSGTLVNSRFLFADSSLANNNILDWGDTSRILATVSFSGSSKFDQIKGYYDELAILSYAETPTQVYKNYRDIITHSHYSFSDTTAVLHIADVSGKIDTLEYPLHYISPENYSGANGPDGQIKAFPIPRLKPGHQLMRNVNLTRATWMAGITNSNPSSGKLDTAITIQNELAENWNYYYNFTENVTSYWQNANTIRQAYTNDINSSGKNYPLAALSFRSQLDVSAHPNSPYHSCLNIDTISGSNPQCLIRCSHLESNPGSGSCSVDSLSLYPRDTLGNIMHPGGVSTRPSWSPLAHNDSLYSHDGIEMARLLYEYQDDTISSGLYLSSDAVNRIKFIMENNEIVTPYTSAQIYKSDTLGSERLILHFDSIYNGLDSAANARLYQSHAKSNIDNAYRDSMLSHLNYPHDCVFSNYFADGHDSHFEYKYMRETQPLLRGNRYPTSQLYTNTAGYWYVDFIAPDGAGWRYITNALNTQLIRDEFGNPWYDKWSAPFVSAGYDSLTEKDMRPGQYLGLLKAVSMTGVDFFQAGYFNSKPTGAGKSYCYQAAMPVYAQAINTRLFDFLDKGHLLYGDYPWDLAVTSGKKYRTAFRFNTGRPNELVVARKMDSMDVFAITGTLQSTSPYIGTFSLDTIVTIQLKSNDTGATATPLSFPIRRQGSTYVFDNTNTSDPVFWQVDGWHEWIHPERWSKDFSFEAEVMDNVEANSSKDPLPGVHIKTESTPHSPIPDDIFAHFTSYISFDTPSPLEYRFQPRADGVTNDYKLYVKARTKINGKLTGFALTLTDLTGGGTVRTWKVNCVNVGDWQWYAMDACSGAQIAVNDLKDNYNYQLSLVPFNNYLELDSVYVAQSSSTFAPPITNTCAYDTVIYAANNSTNNFSTVFGGNNINHIRVRVEPFAILNIDDNDTVSDCLFTMGDSSSILMTTGSTYSLNINQSNFSSCDSLWNGILSIDNGNSVNIDTSALQDARTGIAMSDGAIKSVNTLFDKNDTAIGANNSPCKITGSVFDCSGKLKPGDGVTRSSRHVNAYASEIRINHSSFRNAGYGVYQDYREKLFLTNSGFQRNDYGVLCNNMIDTIMIDSNTFIPDYNAQGVMPVSDGYGVGIWGPTVDTWENVLVNNNTITDYYRGILVYEEQGGKTFEIKNNKLKLTRAPDQLDTNTYRGIKLVDCNGFNVQGNHAEWTKSDSTTDYNDKVQGIALEASNRGTVKENLLENLGAGIRTKEDCSYSYLLCNRMQKCYTGVWLDTNGVSNILTDQGYWTGVDSTSQSWNNHWIDIKNPGGYKVDGTVALFYNFNWVYDSTMSSEYSPVPSSGIFFTIPCPHTTSDCTPPKMMMGMMREALYGDAVGDSAYFDELEPEFLYNGKQAFYSAAIIDTSILHAGNSDDAKYVVQFDSLKQINIGKLVAADTLAANENFANAAGNLNALIDPNIIEQNKKFALETYMNYYAQGLIPDSSTLEQMDGMLYQNPFFGGKAIYLIRSLLHKDIEDVLPQINSRRKPPLIEKTKQPVKENFNGKLYPNPAKDLIHYSCNLNENEHAILIIQNAMGSEIARRLMQNNEITISTKLFQPGIYYYIVTVKGTIKDKGKLIICR